MKAAMAAQSFTPRLLSTPPDTSTPSGLSIRMAVATLAAVNPPATHSGDAASWKFICHSRGWSASTWPANIPKKRTKAAVIAAAFLIAIPATLPGS